MHDAVRQAREEFELVPGELALGTSQLYSRSNFLELDDERAIDEGDFLGRLRALFGPVEGDEWVLRHRASGIVVTAYSAQSGPSFGGGPGIDPDLSPQEAAMFVGRMLQDSQARIDRLQSDPELVAGHPSQRPENAHLQRGDWHELRALDHVWRRRFADANAPDGVPEVIARLCALIEAVPPADWEALRYYGDAPSVYRIGAHDGESFTDMLDVAEAMAVLLDYAEREDRSMIDTAGGAFDDPDLRVVETWIAAHEQDEGEEDVEDEEDDEDDEDEEGEDEEDEDEGDEEVEEDEDEDEDDEDEDEEDDEDDEAQREADLQALAAVLPRVQQAWFRGVARLSTYSAEVADALADIARGQIAVLQLDPKEADTAIRAGLKR